MSNTHNWRKSSYSPNAANCVYVRNDRDGTLRLRESDVPEVTLEATPTTFGAFVRAAKAGKLDHLGHAPAAGL
jgi:hypothetical protein